MSPFDGTAGFSNWTPEKYALVNDVIATWKPKAMAVARKHTNVEFGFVDAAAGPGRINGRAGTPLMLASLAREFDAPLVAFERDPATHARLATELGAAAVRADSLEALRDAAHLFPRFGLLIYDPNPRDGTLPIEELNRWEGRCPRDLLAFISATSAYKRKGLAEQLAADVRALRWPHVCLTEPRRDQQWVAIFATHWDRLASDVCRRVGFEPVDDPTGADRLRVASTVGARRSEAGQLTMPIEGAIFPYE